MARQDHAELLGTEAAGMLPRDVLDGVLAHLTDGASGVL